MTLLLLLLLLCTSCTDDANVGVTDLQVCENGICIVN